MGGEGLGVGKGRGGREGGEERGEGSEGTGREERRRGGEGTPQGLVHTPRVRNPEKYPATVHCDNRILTMSRIFKMLFCVLLSLPIYV